MARGALAGAAAQGALMAGLVGCQDDTEPGCAPEGPHLVVATNDTEVGALATVDGASCTGDRWSQTSPDAIVRAVGDRLLSIDRTGGNAVRVFSPGRYGRPLREFVIEEEGNVHDALAVGDEWWFTLYDGDAIARTDAQGEVLGRIDLSAWADGDDQPEPDQMVLLGDTVYVALQKLERGSGWAPTEGSVLALSPDGDALSETPLGPNPKLWPHPAEPEALLALTGRWYEPDGALVRFDPRDGSVTELLTEVELGFDLGGLAGLGSHLVLLGVDFDGTSRLLCLDLETGERVEGRSDAAWFIEALSTGEEVYLAVRKGWNETPAREIRRVDPVTCEDELVSDALSLDPFSMAWVAAAPAASR